MIFKSFSALLKDTIFTDANCKYKIKSFLYEQEKTLVECETIDTAQHIIIELNDIIRNNKLQFFSASDVLLLSNMFSNKNDTRVVAQVTDVRGKFYYPIAIAFITCLLISNLAAVKVCNFLGFSLPGGTLIFPLLYVLNDVLTEVYGFTASRKVILIALLCNCCLSATLYCVVLLPPAEYWQDQESFAKVFLVSPRIFVSSLSSYFVGEMMNAAILTLLKLRCKGRFFAIRAICSTFIGSLLESIIFCYLVFLGQISHKQIIIMAISLTLIKVVYEILVMPVTVKIVGFLKTAENKDVFEKPYLTNFNKCLL